MMKKLLLNSTLCLFAISSMGQSLPIERRTLWSDDIVCTVPSKTISFNDYLLRFQGNCDLAMEAAILEAEGSGTLIVIDSGQYYFQKSILLKSGVHIRGNGSNRTELIFVSADQSGLLMAKGKTSTQYPLIQPWETHQQYILHPSMELIPGMHVKLGFNDAHLITSSWAKGSVCQINQIVKRSGDTLFLRDPVRLENAAMESFIQIIEPVRNISVSHLKIKSGFQRNEQISNIEFEYVSDARVQSIESDSCLFAHVSLNYCNNISVSGSYFRNAYDYGNGGKGYGVVLQYGSGGCVIDNNIFVKLRHSILLQAGANGNMVAYNYSREPFWTGTTFHSSLAGDIVLHGNYPLFNLFEGNICQNLVIDDSHGQNGPYNTFFRNQIEHFGIFMNASPISQHQNFVNNEIIGTGSVKQGLFTIGLGNYLLQGQTQFESWNRTLFTTYPENSSADPALSYYLSAAPDYWTSGIPYPFCGGSSPAGTMRNPAWMRYHYNQIKTYEQNQAPDLRLIVSGDKSGLKAEWQSGATTPTRNFILFEQKAGAEILSLMQMNLEKMADTGLYFYEDHRPRTGKYLYRLVQTLTDGSEIESSRISVDYGEPEPVCKISVTLDGKIRICETGLYAIYHLNGVKITEFYAVAGQTYNWPLTHPGWLVVGGMGQSTLLRK